MTDREIIGAVRYGSPLSQFGANVVKDMPTELLVDWLINDETDVPTGHPKEGWLGARYIRIV
jgi:hypothetical protein